MNRTPADALIVLAPEMVKLLALAAEGLEEYYKYGQTMRAIGRGFDWGETPGSSTTGFVARIRTLLARIAGPER